MRDAVVLSAVVALLPLAPCGVPSRFLSAALPTVGRVQLKRMILPPRCSATAYAALSAGPRATCHVSSTQTEGEQGAEHATSRGAWGTLACAHLGRLGLSKHARELL